MDCFLSLIGSSPAILPKQSDLVDPILFDFLSSTGSSPSLSSSYSVLTGSYLFGSSYSDCSTIKTQPLLSKFSALFGSSYSDCSTIKT